MKLFQIAAVTILSLTFYACVPFGEHCPEENEAGGATAVVNPCNVKPEAGPCEASITKYYFNESSGKCEEFQWGGCQGTVPFHTLKECTDCAGTPTTEPAVDPNAGTIGSPF